MDPKVGDSVRSTFDSFVYQIDLACTKEELNESFMLHETEGILSPPLRSLLHEHCHLIQYATTIFGYYMNLVETFQRNAMVSLVNCCLEDKVDPYGVVHQIMARNGLPKENTYYYDWALGEIVRIQLTGTFDELTEYLCRIMKGNGFLDYYGELDLFLSRLSHIPKKLRADFLSPEVDPQIAKQLLAASFMNDGLQINVSSILESQAHLTQYFFDSVADEAFCAMMKPQQLTREKANYLVPLQLYWKTHQFDLQNPEDFMSFKLGFFAICDLALNAPMLPFYRHPLFEPMTRFTAMIVMTQKIRPPRHLEDYSRYQMELVRWCGLSSPWEDSRMLQRQGSFFKPWKQVSSNCKEKAFLDAQRLFQNDRLMSFHFLSASFTPQKLIDIVFQNGSRSIFRTNCEEYFFLRNVHEYYHQLVMGKAGNGSHRQIEVSIPNDLDQPSYHYLSFCCEQFNRKLRHISKKLPCMVLVPSKKKK